MSSPAASLRRQPGGSGEPGGVKGGEWTTMMLLFKGAINLINLGTTTTTAAAAGLGRWEEPRKSR